MPPTKTGHLLKKLRSLMKNTTYVTETIQAYIIPSGDNHQSEYVAACDKRREFISGFTGSAGTAIVTEDDAGLWTDGRYFLQAGEELDENWRLMKEGKGIPNAVTQGAWLNKVLPLGSRVGVDPFLMGLDAWNPLSTQLESYGHNLVPILPNLIDLVWDDRPEPPTNQIVPLNIKFAGVPWSAKIKDVQQKMEDRKVATYIVTALDDIAWLLNVRGSDIEFNPVFFSYVIVTVDSVRFFVDEAKLSPVVMSHLQEENCPDINIQPYDTITDFVKDVVSQTTGNILVSKHCSYGIVNLIPEKRRVIEPSLIEAMKAIKNQVEIAGMQQAHIKDAVALCEYFAWLETEVVKETVTEISGAEKLLQFRREQEDFVGLSFETISSVGSNGAVIHYTPSPETDKLITTHELYLCDSGGQYRDGTTDVTRTVHFGTPSEYERMCFTCVLKGHINLATAIFPAYTKGQLLDTLARTALWEQGLDYQHGTGHGVGSYLNVHEGPSGISLKHNADDPGLQEGMILTDEPGYYDNGKFGIRIESVVLVKKAETSFHFNDRDFLTFDLVTLVPIQTKMLDPTLLTAKEVDWLDNYHQRCREVIGKVLEKEGRHQALEWLMRETQPLG